MKILNFGSLNIDNVYHVSHIVREGETISSNGFNTFIGGKGLNQSIAIARAGGKVFHAGMVGSDGQMLINALKKDKVNIEFIKKMKGKSGNAIIQVDENGQNSIILYGGANLEITKDYIDEVLANFQKNDVLLLQNEISHIDYICQRAYEKDMKIAFNPSPINEKIGSFPLEKVEWFFINEIEGKELTGKDEPVLIVEELMKKYSTAKVILTLGKDGVLYKEHKKMLYQKAFDVKVVDTTAAGDTFTGYFLALLMEGLPLEDVLMEASKAASVCVSKKGAAASIPVRGKK